jgi:hypothetical protein
MQLLEKEEWMEFGDLLMVRCELICRPVENQRLYYTGYKRFDAVKYQAIFTTDGLISSLAGPYLGKEGDWPLKFAELRAFVCEPWIGLDHLLAAGLGGLELSITRSGSWWELGFEPVSQLDSEK